MIRGFGGGQSASHKLTMVRYCSQMTGTARFGGCLTRATLLSDARLVVANEAALDLYRRAWACDPSHYFEAHTKYLQLADKASRTVALLTERLDQHRGRGQKQIIVKHGTDNAEQGVAA